MHFTKVGAQTEASLERLRDEAAGRGLPHGALDALVDALAAARRPPPPAA